MPEKKPIHSNPISDSDILAMYKAVMPLLYDNPKGLDLTDRINEQLLRFVKYDFDHYIMEDTQAGQMPSNLRLIFERWESPNSEPDFRAVSIQPSIKGTAHETFEQEVERTYQMAIARSIDRNPEHQTFHYYRIASNDYPKIAVGFFRYKNVNNFFTVEEKELLTFLTPHILLLYRTVLTQVCQSQAFQYFAAFTKLSSKLASDHGLSDAEVRLLPDILFGYSNEEIAERQFIAVATVKSHIKHIFKKTGVKTRVDFISKFFTSPESVKL